MFKSKRGTLRCKFPDYTSHVSKCRNNMAEGRVGTASEVRETDLNDDIITGAIGANATTEVELEEEYPRPFPGMDEMLKVATDLQRSGGDSIELNDSRPGELPQLEVGNTGEEAICTDLFRYLL